MVSKKLSCRGKSLITVPGLDALRFSEVTYGVMFKVENAMQITSKGKMQSGGWCLWGMEGWSRA